MVRERVVRESTSSAQYPTLTRSNYAEWAMVMRVQLQAQHLWDAIEYGVDEDEEHADRAALAALLRAVPPELVRTLAAKDNAKAAWDTLKTMRLGSERIREAKAQTRRREFEELCFRAGESIEDFSIRLTSIVSDLELLGDPISEYKAVLKFLRVVPRKYRAMVMAIEQVVNLRELTIEELCGRLLTAEEGYNLDDATDGVNKLLLTEEEWASRQRQRGKGVPGGNVNSGKPAFRRKQQGAQGGGTGSGERRKGNCRYCGKAGHWVKECRKAKRDREQRGEVANLVQAEDEDDGLLMATHDEVAVAMSAVETTHPSSPTTGEQVFLNEERAHVELRKSATDTDAAWYLDTGASNHMTGDASVFAELNEKVSGMVRFGDGSLVDIRGRGTVMFAMDDG